MGHLVALPADAVVAIPGVAELGLSASEPGGVLGPALLECEGSEPVPRGPGTGFAFHETFQGLALSLAVSPPRGEPGP